MTTARWIAARSCSIAGTVLAALPITVPLAFVAVMAVAVGGVHLDWLMPGELFLLVLAGDILLVIAAVLVRRHVVLVSVPAALTVVLFGATMWIAVATGLASGRTEPSGWPLALLIVVYGSYVAAIVAVFVAGVFLSRTAFARAPQRTAAHPARRPSAP